jgi:hypothetical protein
VHVRTTPNDQAEHEPQFAITRLELACPPTNPRTYAGASSNAQALATADT